jgi:hypothetical protein
MPSIFATLVTMAVRTQHKLAQHYVQDIPPNQQPCLKPSDVRRLLAV